MFIKRKKNRSGTVSIVVAEKISGCYKELATIGIARNQEEIDSLVAKGHKWMDAELERRHPRLDLFGEERQKCEEELLNAEQMLSCITNISINGADLILDRVFDSVGFNRIDYDVFRKLVKARLSYPASKAATVEYLKNHFDEDVSLSKIYRYLDKLSDNQHKIVSGHKRPHTKKILGGHISVLFMMSPHSILKRTMRTSFANGFLQGRASPEPSDYIGTVGQHWRLSACVLHP